MPGMKSSTIKVVLRKKIKNWLSTIWDDNFREQVSRDVIVTGGAISSMLLGEKINDYDIYFRTREIALRVATHYVELFNQNKHTKDTIEYTVLVKEEEIVNIKGITENRIIIYMKSAGIAAEDQAAYEYFESKSDAETEQFFNSFQDNRIDTSEGLYDQVVEMADELSTKDKKEKSPYRPIFLSDNAITLSDKIQLITRFYGEPFEIHKNFDFVHALCWYDFHKDELELPRDSLQALLSKTLIYTGSLYPIASLFRARKFIQRGWRITAGQMLKIIWQVNDIDLGDFKILREQLIGVDQAYMYQLIKKLQEPGIKIDSTYLARLIDEIFE